MGNMLPCLVQGSSSILPPVNTKHWSRSMKLLVMSTLRRSTKRSHHGRTRVASSRETSSTANKATPRARSLIRGGQDRRAIRVKVVLTRAEAAQLLSLTAHGHRTAAQVVAELMTRRQAAQVISELKRMEELVARENTSSPPSTTTAWRPVLESIPEE